jgi:hypothetical protein
MKPTVKDVLRALTTDPLEPVARLQAEHVRDLKRQILESKGCESPERPRPVMKHARPN